MATEPTGDAGGKGKADASIPLQYPIPEASQMFNPTPDQCIVQILVQWPQLVANLMVSDVTDVMYSDSALPPKMMKSFQQCDDYDQQAKQFLRWLMKSIRTSNSNAAYLSFLRALDARPCSDFLSELLRTTEVPLLLLLISRLFLNFTAF